MKRTPVRGVKQYLKPHAYKQWEGHARFSQEKGASPGAAAKASLNRALELQGFDAKRDDLSVARLKAG